MPLLYLFSYLLLLYTASRKDRMETSELYKRARICRRSLFPQRKIIVNAFPIFLSLVLYRKPGVKPLRFRFILHSHFNQIDPKLESTNLSFTRIPYLALYPLEICLIYCYVLYEFRRLN